MKRFKHRGSRAMRNIFAKHAIRYLLLFCGTIALTNCSSMKRIDFELPAQDKKLESWETVFSNPSPITVETFVSGKVLASTSYIYDLGHPKMAGTPDSLMELPVLVHLVTHEKFGAYLIDTGLDSAFQQHEYGSVKGMLVKRMMGKFRQNRGENISSILRKRSIHPQAVFFTHLHPDHVLGAAELSPNMHYVVGKAEKYIHYPPFFYTRSLSHIDTLHEIPLQRGAPIAPFRECVDVFGDGSFWAMSSKGHTRGHLSYLVNGIDRTVLVCGDACNTRFALDNKISPGSKHSVNPEMAQRSVRAIATFVNSYPQVRCLFGHELPERIE